MNTGFLFSFALAAAVSVPSVVQAQQALVPAQSEIQFVSKQMGVPVEGKFKTFSGQVAFDPAKLASSKIAFTVDTGSADISREANAELPKATWFNVAQFPKATFKSTSIKGLGNGKFEVAGKLDVKGTSRDVVVPVQITQSGANSTATGSFVIKRLDFKIGEAEWTDTTVVANDVTVKFKLALTGVPKL